MPKRPTAPKRSRSSSVAATSEPEPARSPTRSVFTLRTLTQARVLSDPLRIRILAEFVSEPRTTKQVADRLGEPPTKLYRHVDALFDAGLLELKEERRKRGTIERYLQAVASRFEVDRSLFASAGDQDLVIPPKELSGMVKSLFDETEREFLTHCGDLSASPQSPILMRVVVRGSKKGVAKLRQKLETWLEECRELAPSDAPAEVEYGGLIAFYPVAETATPKGEDRATKTTD